MALYRAGIIKTSRNLSFQHPLATALEGGGARGALQVGALRALGDFSHTAELIERGYQIAQAEIQKRLEQPSPAWLRRLSRWLISN
ncbi:MAG: hypothetical protein ACK44E_06665 [Anaerolineales bacterium]